MSLPGIEEVASIEQELIAADEEFCRAAENKDWEKALSSHKRICRLVASLSASWSGGKARVFASYLEAETQGQEAQTDDASEDGIPDIAALEKELAELAAKMQMCLQAGDMDGMLAANMKMGELSELMAKAEQEQKSKKQSRQEAEGSAKQEATPAKQGSWAAGDSLDTLTLARQRAESRKKNQKRTDSFLVMMGQTEEAPAPAAEAEKPASAVDSFFSAKMKAKLGSDSGKSKALNQDQLREKLEESSFYDILSAPSTASFEELHKCFLRKIRKLHKQLASNTIADWQFQEFVNALCLAHDVLKYPNARLQYDLGLFGVDGSGPSPEQTAKQKMVPLREMIKFSTLVAAKDLAAAAEEMEGDKDERSLGHHLVDKGLLSAEEFDSILFAQKLVSSGKLTVAQFELAMQELRENSIPLLDTLVGSEWIQPQDVFSLDSL